MRRASVGAVIVLLAGIGAFAGCGSAADGDRGAAAPKGECPTAPLPVVVTVGQWGDIVDRLAGACGDVTTIVKGSAADPHDYEPMPADTAELGAAKLVVLNGLGYDGWANKAIDTLDAAPAVVDGGKVAGLAAGANPHIWYGPTYVTAVANAVTARLKDLAPEAAVYFEGRHAAWTTSTQPYLDEIARVRARASGSKTYGATEPVFDYMAAAVGLVDKTPPGYRKAATNGSDSSPGDVYAFEEALRSRKMSVLVSNTQTRGSRPDQLRRVARRSRVPVVDVTESIPRGTASFLTWQVGQLERLATALGP